MSGLIWSALGQAVSNAAGTVGGMMLRNAEDQRRREDEERREAAAVKRMEEADRIKSEREERRTEELEQRVAREARDVRTQAEMRGAERLTRAAEESAREAASRARNPATIESNIGTPGYGQSSATPGAVGEKLTPSQQRLQRATDEADIAAEMGAHSSVIKFYEKKRSDVLAEIREENREKRETAKQESTERRLDMMQERIESQNRADQARADAAARQPAPTSPRQLPTERLTTQAETLRKAAKEASGQRKRDLEDELDQVLAELKRRRESSGTPGAAPAPSSAASGVTKGGSKWIRVN